MGESAAELRREIEGTRAGLGETLEAIGDRVSPGRMVERRKNRMAMGLRTARDRVMGMVDEREHDVQETLGAARNRATGSPMMAGAVAFGTGFLVAAAFPPSRSERAATEQLLEKARPLTDEVAKSGRELAEHLRDPAQEALSEVRDTVSDGARTVADTAKGGAARTTDEAADAARTVRSEAERVASLPPRQTGPE